jgi:SAUR family protein
MEKQSNAHEAVVAAEPVTGLRKIVWIRQMLQRWQSTAADTATRRSDASATGGEPDAAAHHHIEIDTGNDDNDDSKPPPLENGPMTPGAPVDVPRGCCAVYVGAERRRFVVPTAYLGMPVFRRLLEKAEEEFEFDYADGALTIPCDTEAFKYILVVMDRHQKGLVVVDHGTHRARARVQSSLDRHPKFQTREFKYSSCFSFGLQKGTRGRQVLSERSIHRGIDTEIR